MKRCPSAHRVLVAVGLFSLSLPVTAEVVPDPVDKTDVEPTPSLADVYDRSLDARELEMEIGSRLARPGVPERHVRTLAQHEDVLTAVEDGFRRHPDLSELSYSQLLDLDTALRLSFRQIDEVRTELAETARGFDRDLDQIAGQKQSWADLEPALDERDAPAQMSRLVDESVQRLERLAAQLRERRDATLDLLGRATADSARASEALGAVAARRLRLSRAAEQAGREPLWAIGSGGEAANLAGAGAELHFQAQVVSDYLRMNTRHLVSTLLSFLIAAIVLLRWSRRGAAELIRGDETAAPILRVLDRPVAPALVTALIGTLLLERDAPVMVRDLAWLLLPLPAAIVCVELFARPVWRSIYTLAFALMLLPSRCSRRVRTPGTCASLRSRISTAISAARGTVSRLRRPCVQSGS
jgi:hypothetical protein